MNELSANGVKIYSFPVDDETVAEANKVMNVSIQEVEYSVCQASHGTPSVTDCLFWQGHVPFAVVGSSDEVKIGNKMVKARQYPWGTVQGSTLSEKERIGQWSDIDSKLKHPVY